MKAAHQIYSKTRAFFIAPDGQVLPVATSHIDKIIQEPERFGLGLAKIRSLYEAYNETLGTEGKARREILLGLVQKGWVRIRLHPNSHWSINVYELDIATRDRLWAWAAAYLRENETAPNFDPYLKVRIEVFKDGSSRNFLLDEIINIKEMEK